MEACYTWERVHITQDISRSCSSCDCDSYSHFLVSVFLFALGSILSMFSLGAFEETVYGDLGKMWMFGPFCICSAITLGIRNVLYLRRRRIINTVIRQSIADFSSPHAQLANSLPIRTISELDLLPSYEQLFGIHNEEDSDLPPPTYEEAIVSISKRSNQK